ncbi:AAA family ATPase [Paenibacillus ehimensis]|uniref:ATP-binding protein n=1 Tax=Paenibacillus ehimensis TaxID=79264 RepID=A0ABT8VGB5_9BACL|nr:AAA family ATPase [Paenibacillus ehimensis]MDO3680004.1 ATP-binding protein [Paenibacillus ehimensis]MEC0209765.1 ATP-binding protein [Paenibacillus ehimensis]
MECVLFIGIQASGKSTFYKEQFFNSHIRINLDMLKTRHREDIYIAASIQAKQPFVVDNTNPGAEDRKKYIEAAKRGRFKVIGYYFEPDFAESVKRNELRAGAAKIPEIGIKSVLKKLTPPGADEGFDELYKVTSQNGKFIVTEL